MALRSSSGKSNNIQNLFKDSWFRSATHRKGLRKGLTIHYTYHNPVVYFKRDYKLLLFLGRFHFNLSPVLPTICTRSVIRCLYLSLLSSIYPVRVGFSGTPFLLYVLKGSKLSYFHLPEKPPRYGYVQTMVFSTSFCRNIYLLFHASSSYVKRYLIIHSHRRGMVLHNISATFSLFQSKSSCFLLLSIDFGRYLSL